MGTFRSPEREDKFRAVKGLFENVYLGNIYTYKAFFRWVRSFIKLNAFEEAFSNKSESFCCLQPNIIINAFGYFVDSNYFKSAFKQI